MFKSFRQRMSQSGGSRPSVIDDVTDRSRVDSIELGDGAESSLGGGLDSLEGDSDDPFDSSLDRRPRNNWRSSSADRQIVRRLHSASSAVTVDRIDPQTATGAAASGQPLGLKQRAKKFLFRRRSFSSLDTHKIDGRAARINPKLVSNYAKRHHSDDCMLDAGDREATNASDLIGSGNTSGEGIGTGKKKNKFSRSLSLFTSMRHRSRSRDATHRRPEGRVSTGGGSSDGGWTDASAGTGTAEGSVFSGGDVPGQSSTLGRRGHRNSEQYMAPPPVQQRQQPQPHHPPYLYQQQRQISSAHALATSLDEISGYCLERNQLRSRIGELLTNWPAVPLEGVSPWLLGGSSSGVAKSKRFSMAFKKAPFFSASPSPPTGSSTPSGSFLSSGYSGTGSNLTSVSQFSGSTAEQLNVLCRQFNQAVTLRKSYRGKDNLAAGIPRRSSGHWSGSSGSSGRTAESKSFTKQTSNSTTASKDSALELNNKTFRFDDPGGSHRRQSPSQVSSSPNESHAQSQPQPHYNLHHHQNQQAEHTAHHRFNNHHQQQSPSPQSPSFRFPSSESSAAHPSSEGHQHPAYYQPNNPQYQYTNGRSAVHGYENIQPKLAFVAASAAPEDGAPAPVPPRRSTSLRQSTESIDTLSVPVAAAADVAQISPTYLNHMVLSGPSDSPSSMPPSSTSQATIPSMATSITGGKQRLDLISESPDDEAAEATGSPSPPLSPPPSQPPQLPARTSLRLPYSRPARPVSISGDTQHQQQQSESSGVGYQQWRGALPYSTQSSSSSSSSLTSTSTSAPPRPRQPLLPTGDSARIVREARAKLSQLNRLSAELARRQQHPAPLPAVCPFDALSMMPSARRSVSGNAAASAVNSRDAAAAHWRNSLLLQDELAVREYLKDLTTACSTDY